jgi:phytanoyl-CoA hydroxylase
MCGVWLAVEDIAATAGRFFICPRSHLVRLNAHSLTNNIAESHEAYISSVVDEMKRRELEIRAPALRKGDVLFFNALTIHGSLKSQDQRHARSSITAHAIPASKNLLQFQSRVLKLKADQLNGTALFRPKDLASLQNRAVLFMESRFSAQFYWLKKKAIVHVMKRNRAKTR